MKVKIKHIQKIIMDKRLIKSKTKLYSTDYSHGYTDAINDILTDLHRIE